MFECKDQLNRTIILDNFPPKRIISLVPSQTELLFDLGLDKAVIGITKFCVHPQEWFKTKTRIGGTKNIDIEKIKSLKPDLVIANKEENIKDQIETIEKFCPVYISDVNNLHNAFKMIEAVGNITNTSVIASRIVDDIKNKFSQINLSFTHKKSVLYLIWREPFMTIGGDTFIAEILRCCGFQNVCENEKRYPVITNEAIEHLDCGLVFLSSEPYPFRQKHIDELQELLPNAKVILVDGEMFSWYGSRLIFAAEYVKNFIASLFNDA